MGFDQWGLMSPLVHNGGVVGEKQGLPSGLTPQAFRFSIVRPKAQNRKFEALPGFLVPSGLTPQAFRFAT